MSPLSRQMPCPDCGHEHLFLSCDFCDCTHVTIPGVTLEC